MMYLIILTLALAPTYVLRFIIARLPTDVLMLWVFFVWIIFYGWLLNKKKVGDFFQFKTHSNKKIILVIFLFLFSGLLSLFVNGINRAKLGQFLVLFLQPISIFFISGYLIKQNPKLKNYLLLTTYYLLAIAGLYALLQYFTLLGLPPAWWGNSDEPKRAISFFIHPNFYALWSAPLLALLIPDLLSSIKTAKYKLKTALWLVGGIGLFLSLSRAGWLGLGAAIIVYLLVAADNKTRRNISIAFAILILVIFAVPNFRYRILLPFYGEKSAVSRFSLWQTGLKGIKESPIFGLGLSGFSKQWGTLNSDANLTDTHNYPHNIFLDFWVETGLLGVISFIILIWLYIKNGLKNKNNIFLFGVSLFLIALLFQGQIDNPYFKNDLALIFWLILSLTI